MNEILRAYIDHFMQVVVELEGVDESLKCWIFENDMFWDNLFRKNLGRKEACTTDELMIRAQSFINLEENLNT